MSPCKTKTDALTCKPPIAILVITLCFYCLRNPLPCPFSTMSKAAAFKAAAYTDTRIQVSSIVFVQHQITRKVASI